MDLIPTIDIDRKVKGGRTSYTFTIVCRDEAACKTITSFFQPYMPMRIPRNEGTGMVECRLVLKKTAQYGPNIMRICLPGAARRGLPLHPNMADHIFEQTILKTAVSQGAIVESDTEDPWEILSFTEDKIYVGEDETMGTGAWTLLVKMNTNRHPKAEDCLNVDLTDSTRPFFIIYEKIRFDATFHLHQAVQTQENSSKDGITEQWDGCADSLIVQIAKQTASQRRRVIKSVNTLRGELQNLLEISPETTTHELEGRESQVNGVRTAIKFLLKRLEVTENAPMNGCASPRATWQRRLKPWSKS